MRKGDGSLSADFLLLLTAMIWGFAFVAQRAGMGSIGPFAYNAARYALGALSLLPIILLRRPGRNDGSTPSAGQPAAAGVASGAATDAAATARARRAALARNLGYPLLAGTVLFLGASLQQVGLVTTTAGNAAFITSLYVVLVPLIGLFLGRKVGAKGWLAAALAVAGLYIISVGGKFSVARGDLLVLVGAFFWACHILVIGHLATRTDPILLSAGQFTVCAVYSLVASLLFDPPFPAGSWLEALGAAALPIAYGGILSCGVAFTLQIVGQRKAKPSHASIIMALEALFGAIGGVIILGEPLTSRLVTGGLLMLGGAVLSQVEVPKKRPDAGSR
jgi:drug/metabolite transporter (DMT)-like permease